MVYRPVLKWPDPRLKDISAPVTEYGEDLQVLIRDMYDTLNVEMGVGLAAPQIGIHQRVIILDCDAFDAKNPDPMEEDDRLWTLINPEISLSGDDVTWREACLSVPLYGGDVPRKTAVTVTYNDRHGSEKKVEVSWPLSGCLQHECDHLEGILFIDQMNKRESMEIRKKINRRRRENKKAALKRRRRLRGEKKLIDTRMSHGPGKRKKRKKRKK
tara:strand:- start:10171 stop:10812 length:642 start_codon:yes stop_codon:yes gene_type:complete